jgi:hypothetical protein
MNPLNSGGIKLTFDARGGWVATVEFSTWEHATASCIEGSIGTRYFDADLNAIIDRAMAAAQSIGVAFRDASGLEPHIYVDGDGEDPNVTLPPNWRQLVDEQCKRLGWKTCYQEQPVPPCEATSQVH